MPLLSLTPEQRAAALEKAALVRKERADLKDKLKHGKVTLADALREDCAAKMRVSALLGALPGLGKIRAGQLMDRLGIDESRRVRGLGANQRAALLEEFAPANA